MRCLTLADRLKERGARARFVSREMPAHLEQLARSRGHELIRICPASRSWTKEDDARDCISALGGVICDWLVVDHYSLDASWESALRASARRILAIDDLADRRHDCDLLLDQNLFAEPEKRYAGRVPEGCALLLGPRYALIRPEFGALRDAAAARRSGAVRHILVSFGGVDEAGYTHRTLQALAGLPLQGVTVDVVIGQQHPQRERVLSDCARLGFNCHIETQRMAELMAQADLAIGAAGSTTWERCGVGLPAIAICTAENQRVVLEHAAAAGLVYAPALEAGEVLEHHIRALMDNPALVKLISQRGREAVDGHGASRVARAMGLKAVSVRAAAAEDAPRILEWRNHPATRSFSRNPAPIERASHEAWLAGVLADGSKVLLIGQHEGRDIGVVRFDVTDQEAEVSIYLAPEAASKGLGVELLLAAEAWLADSQPTVRTVRAEVLQENGASHRMFQSGGYARRTTIYGKELPQP